MDELVVEGMLIVVAGRAYAHSRPPVLARPRRGNADLPDRYAPERASDEERPVPPSARTTDRWRVTASVGLAAVIGGILARAAMLL